MAEKKGLTAKEIEKQIVGLKIELLRNPTKKGSIKREIARLLTMRNMANRKSLMINNEKGNALTKLEDVKN